MAFKFIAFFALVAAANAGIISAPQVYHSVPQEYHSAPQEYHSAPQVYHSAPQVYHAAPQVYHAAPAAVVKAAPVAYTAPAVIKAAPVAYAAQPVLTKATEEYDPHPQYKYSYDVQDALSGDSKNQFEERDGDVVRGEYSLIDADGFKRTVQYTADPINGFNAVVNREPLVKTVAAVKTVAYAAPAAVAHYAAPAVVKSIAPAYTTYSAPATYGAHHH